MVTNDGTGAAPAVPSAETGVALDWTAVRVAVRCQRCKVDPEDRYDIIEWKKSGGFLHELADDRCAWFIAEQEAEGEADE